MSWLFSLHLDLEVVAVVAFKAGLGVHAVAGRAVGFAAMRAVGIGIHLGGTLGNLVVRSVATKTLFLGGRLHLRALMAGRTGKIGVRTVDRDGIGWKRKAERGCTGSCQKA